MGVYPHILCYSCIFLWKSLSEKFYELITISKESIARWNIVINDFLQKQVRLWHVHDQICWFLQQRSWPLFQPGKANWEMLLVHDGYSCIIGCVCSPWLHQLFFEGGPRGERGNLRKRYCYVKYLNWYRWYESRQWLQLLAPFLVVSFCQSNEAYDHPFNHEPNENNFLSYLNCYHTCINESKTIVFLFFISNESKSIIDYNWMSVFLFLVGTHALLSAEDCKGDS